jgi:hypothetical protein
MNKIALIQSHCNSDEKIQILKDNIQKLSSLGVDILLFSHIPLPSDITDKVKYYVFDSTNPILWEERRHFYWWADDFVKLETTVPDYGWTVYNQIIKSFNLIRNDGYEMFFIVCYDLDINEFVVDKIINNRIGTYTHIKPKNVNDIGEFVNVIFQTSLIFLSLSKSKLEIIVDDLNKFEYVQHPELIAEKYLEKIIERNNLDIPNLGYVMDKFHESTSVFDQSQNPEYEIFVDNENQLNFRYIRKNDDKTHVVIINNKLVEITDDVNFFTESHPIQNFGVLVDNQYDDLLPLLHVKNKINKILFK